MLKQTSNLYDFSSPSNLKSLKVILDTNFYVSIGLGSKYLNKLWDFLVVEKALEYEIIMSDALFNEIKAKLLGEKMQQLLNEYSEEKMGAILQKIRKSHTLINPTRKLEPLQSLSDLEDMHLFELAQQEKADFILTNDKQVLKQNPFGVTRIMTYKQFLGDLAESAG
jgi:putative PIN family toxin of toxin-antitoxin system